MRILKYFFLLILLALFATTIFIATQKGNFDVTRSIFIKSPKSTIFNYVNDYRNWETFGSWKKEDPDMVFNYSKNTVGKGGSYSWTGSDGDGNMKTVNVVENSSIYQKMNFNGADANVYWTFKDTVGGTKVSWRAKGVMNFGFKIYSAFNGGVDHIIGNMYEKSLINLGKTLVYELNTYNIQVNGMVKKMGSIYLKQTITSTIANVPRNLRVLIPRMVNFFKKNDLKMHGKPFVIYHNYDTAKGITTLSVCVPIKEEVFTSSGSDITSGKFASFDAVKTTLTGDYSHNQEAWKKAIDYIKKNNLTQDFTLPYVEIYTKNNDEVANPSKWVTEIYIPIKAKVIPVYKPQPTTAIQSTYENTTPAVTPPKTESPENED